MSYPEPLERLLRVLFEFVVLEESLNTEQAEEWQDRIARAKADWENWQISRYGDWYGRFLEEAEPKVDQADAA